MRLGLACGAVCVLVLNSSLSRTLQKQRTAEITEPVVAPSPAAQPPALLVDYMLSVQTKTFSKMTGIELADITIPGTCLRAL